MTDTTIVPLDPSVEINAALPADVDPHSFQITNMRQLQWAAKMAAESRLFGALTKEQAGIIMWKSLRLSVDPIVGLEHIHVINGKPRPDGLLVAYLIKRSPRVLRDTWKDVRSKTECTVSIQLRSGPTLSKTVTIDEIDPSDRKKDNWQRYPERMLYWRCVSLLGQTYFEEQLLGMVPMTDSGTIVDIEAVRDESGVDLSREACPKCNVVGKLTLLPSRYGGAFAHCEACGENVSPPQAVRDTLRGRTEEFLPKLEQGERQMTEAEALAFEPDPTEAILAAAETLSPEPPSDAPVDAAEKDGGSLDPEFMEAAGIEQPEMTRAQIDESVQAVLGHLTVVRKTERWSAALTVLRAHGYDDTPLSAWLRAHPEELANLREALSLDTPSGDAT